MGAGHGNYLSFGQLDLPEDGRVQSLSGEGSLLVPAGFAKGVDGEEFDQRGVEEEISHSWYDGYEGGRHPMDGRTDPYATGKENRSYSWIKGPRYEGLPAETGPLAEMVVSRNPLFTDLVEREGPSAFVRELARLVRPAVLFDAMATWIDEVEPKRPYYEGIPEIISGEGTGLIEASRGALGHWVKIRDGKIEHYQIITPSAWNGSPRDDRGVHGPWEEALLGTPVKDEENPVELGHVVRSFDPCLVCAVHMVRGPKSVGRKRI
jgi:hydrogenase large subunit